MRYAENELDYRTEEQPGLWLGLRDGTSFPIAPRSGELKLATLRFGEVSVQLGAVSGLAPLKPIKPIEFSADGRNTVSYCVLRRDCRLIGEIALEKVHLLMPAGATPVELKKLKGGG